MTVPPCSSIDPRAGVDVAKFREEYCAWGMALAHYAEFRVTMPCALRVRGLGGGLVRAPFTKSDMANLLDLGTYSGQLNNLVIDSFMRSIMPDVFDAARQIRAGKNPPAAVFMPCTFSAKYKDGLRNTVEGYVLDEIALGVEHATQVFQPFSWRNNSRMPKLHAKNTPHPLDQPRQKQE